jgi:hypothetical protein
MEENQQNNDVANMPNIGNHLRSIVGNTQQQEFEQQEVVNEEPAEVQNEEIPVEQEHTPVETDGNHSWMEIGSSKQEEPVQTGPSEKEKLEIMERLLQDHEIKLFLEAKRAGKSLKDVANEYQTVDYGTMDAETLAKHYGQHLGLSDDQIEESIDGISSMTPIQKHELMASWKGKLESAQASKMEQLIGGYRQVSQSQEQIVQKLAQDVDKEAAFIVDKELFGAKLTQKDAEDFKKWVSTFDYLNPDGSYNVQMLRNFWLGAVKMPSIQKANYAKGQSEGRKEILKEVHRPSQNSAAATRLPEVKSNQSDAEKAQKALRAMMSGKF